MSEPIVVTGVGIVSPLGSSAASAWRAWQRGESGIRVLKPGDSRLAQGIDPSPLPEAGRAGFVRDFEPRELIRATSLRRMDWCSRMLVAAVHQATAEVQSTLPEDARARAAVVVGSQFGNQRETARYTGRVLDDGLAAGSPLLFPNLVLNAAAGYAAIELKWTGPNLTVSEHEASGECALAAAAELLRAGACELAVAGGVDEFGDVFLTALAERRLLHPSVCTQRRSSPRGWVIPGEGAAALLLERERSAQQRGARVHAVLEDVAALGSRPAPHRFPSPSRAARVLRDCVERFGPVDALIGLADGGSERAAIDHACLEALASPSTGQPRYATFRAQTGDWGAAGALAVALAALSLAAGALPGPHAAVPHRIALLGAARGGALVPICLRRPDHDVPHGSAGSSQGKSE